MHHTRLYAFSLIILGMFLLSWVLAKFLLKLAIAICAIALIKHGFRLLGVEFSYARARWYHK